MSRGQEKTKKKSEERDVVLRLAVTAMLIWMVIGGIVFAVGVMNPREDPRKGLEKLTKMEEADTAEIDAQIKELEEAERAADEAWANRTVSEKFANSYVLGDSIAQGLYENQALEKSFVTAERDTGVCETEVSMIVFKGSGDRSASVVPCLWTQRYQGGVRGCAVIWGGVPAGA